MNYKTLIVALVATFSSAFITASAVAADADPDYPQPYQSQTTRAAVLQAAQDARAHGQVLHGELPLAMAEFESMKTRAQVHAETLEAIRLGAVPQGEINGVPTPLQLDSIRMAGERALATHLARR